MRHGRTKERFRLHRLRGSMNIVQIVSRSIIVTPHRWLVATNTRKVVLRSRIELNDDNVRWEFSTAPHIVFTARACTRGSYDAKRNRTWSLSEPRRQLGPLAAFEVVLPRARTACEDWGRGTIGRNPKAYFNPTRRNDLRVASAEYKIGLPLWSSVTL